MKLSKIEPGGELIDADALDFIMGAAADVALAKAEAKAEAKAAKSRKVRRSAVTLLWDAVKEGRLPDKPILPASNYWSQKHADAMHAFAVAGDRSALEAYEVGGTNTYSKLLRAYREACLAVMPEQAVELIDVPKAFLNWYATLGLMTPIQHAETAKAFRIDRNDPALPAFKAKAEDLLSNPDLRSDPALLGIGVSARATLKRLEGVA